MGGVVYIAETTFGSEKSSRGIRSFARKTYCLGETQRQLVQLRTKSMATTPNWQHHSRKSLKGRGCCKGALRARRQALQTLLRQLNGVKPRG